MFKIKEINISSKVCGARILGIEYGKGLSYWVTIGFFFIHFQFQIWKRKEF